MERRDAGQNGNAFLNEDISNKQIEQIVPESKGRVGEAWHKFTEPFDVPPLIVRVEGVIKSDKNNIII